MSGEETDWSYTPLPTLSKKQTKRQIERSLPLLSLGGYSQSVKACPNFDAHFLSPTALFGFDAARLGTF